MSKILDSILQAINFIEENLQNDINVQDVANKACYSLYHFIRIFEGITGHTPKDYILRRRISEAGKELADSSKKIIDVCFDYQFGSPEVFSRAFKRILGINPGVLQKKDYHSQLSFLSPIDKNSIKHGENLKETEVEILQLESIQLAGMVTLIREEKEIISEIWGYMANEFHGLNSNEPEKFYGHSFWSNDYDLGGFYLLCGQSITTFKNTQSPLCTRTIPASRYLRFLHKGNVQNIHLTYKYIFQTYLPKTDYTITKPYDFEIYWFDEKGPNNDHSKTEILIPID